MTEPMVQPRQAPAAPTATAASVSPRPGAGPVDTAADPAAAPAPQDGGGEIPPEVAQIPQITAVLAGEPAAVSATIKQLESSPEGKAIAASAETLMKAGIGFYGGLDGKTGVIFNGFYTTGEDLKKADAEGKLLDVAPPFDAVVTASDAKGNTAHKGLKNHPGQLANSAPSDPNQSASAAAQQMNVPGSNTSPGKQKARVAGQQLGSPSSGPKPGSGRLLNTILSPVV